MMNDTVTTVCGKTVEVEGFKDPSELTLEQAEAMLMNSVYAAGSILESLEYAGKIIGNGHHARQKVAAMAVEELRRRWKESN